MHSGLKRGVKWKFFDFFFLWLLPENGFSPVNGFSPEWLLPRKWLLPRMASPPKWLLPENGFSPKRASPQKWLFPKNDFSPKDGVSPENGFLQKNFACNLLKSFPFCIHPFASSIACIFTSYYTHRHNHDNNPIKILFKSWFF